MTGQTIAVGISTPAAGHSLHHPTTKTAMSQGGSSASGQWI